MFSIATPHLSTGSSHLLWNDRALSVFFFPGVLQHLLFIAPRVLYVVGNDILAGEIFSDCNNGARDGKTVNSKFVDHDVAAWYKLNIIINKEVL